MGFKELDESTQVGRPTDYKPEYCDALIKHMTLGFSFESFAGKIGYCKQTLYNWATVNREFLDAYKKGREACRLFWEERGMKGLMVGKRFNSVTWIFNMKNRFKDDWMDKMVREDSSKIDAKVEHSGTIKVRFGGGTVHPAQQSGEDTSSNKV
jgi:hypothetical protein